MTMWNLGWTTRRGNLSKVRSYLTEKISRALVSRTKLLRKDHCRKQNLKSKSFYYNDLELFISASYGIKQFYLASCLL